ncbi:hypothetical protein [Altererythrobacter litoralis]|uniref:Terminase small subunit n=1 Tax=Altererythrobacter litoralis TaxID=3113904 RepID=A0ABU7GHF0_9SPHN|nr:hypothetical protein [Erythrobacteraceae bacterium 1XM1-14]
MLTPKQEIFAQAIADGRCQAEAYRQAYKVHHQTKPETVYKRASELMADGKVAGRVMALRNALADCALWERRQSVRVLRDIALGDAPAANRIQAVRELNLMHGYHQPDRLEVQLRELPPITDESWL